MLLFLARKNNSVAWFMALLLYCDLFLCPAIAMAGANPFPKRGRSLLAYPPINGAHTNYATQKAATNEPTDIMAVTKLEVAQKPVQRFTTGPTQPEMQQFSSVNSSNMVDLFSGDFSYSIPLLDVGGYPVNLGYHGGISMDQEASWCGLGWNINPGTINRNMRGLPDDFSGTDSVRKITSIKENKTIGVTGGADIEIVGVPKSDKGSKDTTTLGTIGASLGVFHNNYKGWGIEHGLNASINSGIGSRGSFSGGLSITNNSQEGLTVSPSVSVSFMEKDAADTKGWGGSYTVSSAYNTRSGIKALQLTTGIRQYRAEEKNQGHSVGSAHTSVISFASPSYTPTITMPFTSTQFSFTGKVGWEEKVVHPSVYLSGYVSKQRIAPQDTLLALPAYGYMYFQEGAKNRAALLDFNREKEIPYREKPAVPHIAIPAYTYDAFSITGEGTGGMFRAYRSDIGFVYDHYIRSKDESGRISIDVGLGDVVHGGIDLNINRAFTQNGPWLNNNPLQQVIDFKKDNETFESVYFRNPGEKSINSKLFYDILGGDDVVTVGLEQPGIHSSSIQTGNYLSIYRNKRKIGTTPLNPQNAVKQERDKRTQVISWLTAKEAEAGALSKYIDNYTYNQFDAAICGKADFDNTNGEIRGLPGEYFKTRNFTGTPKLYPDDVINFNWGKGIPHNFSGFPDNNFSVRWAGRILAPVTGTYTFYTLSDDGVRLRINDSLIIKNSWYDHGPIPDSGKVNLTGGQFYKIQLEYYEKGTHAVIKLEWRHPGQTTPVTVPKSVLFYPGKDTYPINSNLIKEKRINNFRKENHISEITVLNNDGRRYVYGLPVYNLKQKEATFSVNGKNGGNVLEGLVQYVHGKDNSTKNDHDKDRYYNSEEVPAYAHSFLLTGILSPDYSDITGNGISDDDLGDAVKFNYSKICGIANPFLWRAPAVANQVTYNEGLKTDYRDDKGSYVYGERELWYLHSIESKTMLATFVLEDRDDIPVVNERGEKIYNHTAKRLKEINLYSKADFIKKSIIARPVKTVHFEYGYELCAGANNNGTGKLTLQKVWFTYNRNDKGKQNPYVFSYNSKNPSYNLKSYDRWGNYKDPLQNPGSKPGSIITNAEYPYALQDSALAAQNAAAWVLDSIHLPSGGSIKVQYESDDYAFVQNKRAMQLFKIAGLGTSPSMSTNPSRQLYTGGGDHLYVYIKVPQPVSTTQDVYYRYLEGVNKLYFKLFVQMPGDKYGNGYEYVSCYADLDIGASYGVVNANTIWVKLSGISLKGDGGGSFSPLAKAAIQFLRLNLPSKAYPGSETGDNMDLTDAVKMIASLSENIKTAFLSYDRIARNNDWAQRIDTSRSFVRLNNPYHKKYGGGQRVKKIIIYDNWDKMTNQRPAVYGQEYIYTTKKEINGVKTTISSGVASWEPGLGGEENPFRQPVEYVEKIAPLGPVTLGYTEEPLGESFFPAAGVGYSCVRTRTIHYKNKKSANGYDETKFYTAYDFPTYVDRTVIDGDTKKRYKPGLANFLRINARHHLVLSQGFKIELNDMHGKLRSKASYAETDANTPITYSENVYKVENKDAEFKRLTNTVMVMKPNGSIDSAALIGKDVELMMDMREQVSVSNGNNINLNTEMFTVPFVPPLFLIPSLLNLAQREENIFRSAATVKIIQRYGILDSVIQIEKGSRISTKDILYDSETGDVLVSRTFNEFNDYVYNVTYPSHWAYDGMGLAYKNIGATVNHVSIRNGKLSGVSEVTLKALFSSGDEILAAGKQQTEDKPGCIDSNTTFPVYNKIWAIDSSVLYGGAQAFYFIDRSGKPYNGEDITLKVIRSGRRNMFGAVGSVTCLKNPVVQQANGEYRLVVNTDSKIIAASAGEFKQFWKIEDILARNTTETCIPNWRPTGNVHCVQENGVNTGYEEAEEIDANPRSSLYNTLRWVSLGFSCNTCARPAKWVTTGECEQGVNGNYTGYYLQKQIDTAFCSLTSGDTLLVRTLNCNYCPAPAKWTWIGSPRCQTDGNGNTGYLEQQQTDTGTCSSTFGVTEWKTIGQNCTTCARPAKWINVGTPECETDANGNTGYLLQQQTDTAACSLTSGGTRTERTANCTTCARPAKWINIGTPSCEKDGDDNTGYLLQQQTDTAVCSLTSGGTRTERTPNCTTCARPAKWIWIGSPRCQTDGGGNNTGYLEQQRTDTAVCSRSSGVTEWVRQEENCITCPYRPQNWQRTDSSYCEIIFENHQTIYTGYRIYEERNVEPCSQGYLSTRYIDKVSDATCLPCYNCTADDKKCINDNCETGLRECFSSVFNTARQKWHNCFHYRFSDSSVSTWTECKDEDFRCNLGDEDPDNSSNSKANTEKIKDAGKVPEQSVKTKQNQPPDNKRLKDYQQRIETKDDLFYRSVLPQEKYGVYRQRQQHPTNNQNALISKQ
jgi:hypothetical protein